MSDPPDESREKGPASDRRLDSWKEIAAYLGRGVTTVQRWEQEEGLPIRRLPHAKRGSVFAITGEIDAWRSERAREGRRSQGDDTTPAVTESVPAASPAYRVRRFAGVGVAAVVVTAVALWSWRSPAVETARPQSATPIPLANQPGREEAPSFSPDGTRVVYLWVRQGDRGLFVKSLQGGEPRRIPIGDVRLSGHPRWSPRGDLIAFLAREGENDRAVYVVAEDGTGLRRLTGASGVDICWAPDGGSIGFVDRNAVGEPLSIFSISLTTTRRTRLTHPPAGSFGDTHCAFSRDGRLAVARHFNRSQSDVCVIRPGNDDVDRLTYDFDGIEGIDWTPDGREVVFGSRSGLWRTAATTPHDDQPPRRIVPGTEFSYPDFSPGTPRRPARLVYNADTIDMNLWRSRAAEDGMFASERIAVSPQWDAHPALAPDNRRVAFVSNRTGYNELWTASLDGSDPRQVTFHRGPVVITPRWSPDASRLAYSAQIGGNRDIYTVRLDGPKSMRLTWEPSQEENPSWSQDGRWIYFKSDRGGRGQIWKMPADGGPAVRVTVGEGSEAFESADGRQLYFVRSWDVAGLWSMPVGGGPEALLIPEVRESSWAVTDAGIAYFFSSTASREPSAIRLFDLATTRTSVVATLPVTAGDSTIGFAAGRQANEFFWTRLDQYNRDIMVLDWPE